MVITPQQAAFIATAADNGSIALKARAGTGKCLAPSTPILLANGTIKQAQDINPGDYLAGPASPRLVLSTTQGQDQMYKVVPVKGDPFICNEPHILTLTGSNYHKDEVIDIPLSKVLNKDAAFFREWKLWRSPVYYWNGSAPCPPYLYGLWLGDGHCAKMAITTGDTTVVNYLERIAPTIDHYIEIKQTHSKEGLNPNCWDVQFYLNGSSRGKGMINCSPTWALFKSSLSGGYKNILKSFLTTTYTERLELLAGILDADGHLDNKNFEITSKDQFFLDDICFLARSLGFAAYRKVKVVNGKHYYRAHIAGDCDLIPTKLPRKQASARKQVKRVDVTGIKKIISLGLGPYSGFTLDGDGRFLLGDFTVTHNTFSLRQWANNSRKSGIATSFSKSTVKELAEKLNPTRFPAKTMHALGLAALKSGGASPKLDTSKMFNIVKTLCEDNEVEFELQSEIRALATIAKTYGIQPDRAGPQGMAPAEPFILAELADYHDIEFSDEIFYYSMEAVKASNEAFKRESSIDFDDMLYCALIFPHRFSRTSIILADEVQDFNALQHKMLERCLSPSGRVIAAGDDRQAIYGFRGALADSYKQLVSTFKMRELPLTVSHRCPKEVIKVAQEYVPDIEAAPDNPQGAVLYPTSLDLIEVPKTVLCRNNAPLMKLALQLLVSGRTVEIAGRDIGQGLIKLTKRITRKDLPTPEFLDRLEKWKEKEIARFPRRKPSIMEKAAVLRTLASAHKTLGDMQKHLAKLYPDSNSKDYRPAEVHLSTIHKAKGREWPRVLFLDSHLIGKHAKQDWEVIQEQNLAYVAVTRAQQELTMAASSQIEGLDGSEEEQR